MISSMSKALDLRDSYRGPDLRLFVRDVRDRQGRKRQLTVRSWSTVKDVKDVLQQILLVPPSAQRLFYGPLMTSGGELPNHRTLQDAGIYRSGETLLLEIKSVAYAGVSPSASSISSLRASAVSDVCISSSMLDATPKLLRGIVQQARRGLNLGLKPELVLDGSGGTYFLHDARKVKVAVFKPADEEPYAENNPRGYVKHVGAFCPEDGLRAGISPGEACLREVAAYLLDHNSFSGVPMTTLAEARHPAFNTNGAMLKVSEGGAAIGSHALGSKAHASDEKAKKVGSFQEFVKAECTIDDLSPSKISVDEVHKVAILDIRIMNADRNSANLLCRRRQDDTFELIPIDHGYCLRSVCDVSWMDWCWLDWPQLKMPLSEKSKKYVLDIDIDADAEILKEHLNISSEALDYFRASSKLLQAGVKAGLSLYDIAIMCCRNDDAGEVPSKLEVLTSMASELASSAVENGRWHHTAAVNALAEQLSPEGGSLLSPRSETETPRMSKSASSVNFSSFIANAASELDADEMATNDAPAMTQSAASDSSSDVGDSAMEREEREEWAASVIADVSMSSVDFKRMMASRRKQRSHSTDGSEVSSNSEDSILSSSPVGFWHVRPGSECDQDSDDEESWSPHMSPRNTVEIFSPRNSLKLSSLPRYLGKDSARSTTEGHEKDEGFRSPTVRFLDSWSGGLLPPASVNVTSFKNSTNTASFEGPHDDATGSSVFEVIRKNPSMTRSQSYSAFSAFRSSSIDSVSSGERNQLSSGNDSDQFKAYFAKFVDLVIVRETAAATDSS